VSDLREHLKLLIAMVLLLTVTASCVIAMTYRSLESLDAVVKRSRDLPVSPIVAKAVIAAEDSPRQRRCSKRVICPTVLTTQLVRSTANLPLRGLRFQATWLLVTVIAEARYSRAEITRAYLDNVYLGTDHRTPIIGIRRGADHYFGKTPETLCVSDAALLAALIRGPRRYSPHTHPEESGRRRDLVLSEMLALGFIDERSYHEAIAASLPGV
jgi:membrane carboxypeptidase/penicillin-binding protein PbpC